MAKLQESPKRHHFTPRARSTASEPKSSRRLSVILLAVGIIITLSVASWLGFLHNTTDAKLEIKDIEVSDTAKVELTGARYQGMTSSGQPFSIAADQASQATDGSGLIEMHLPRATITTKNGEVIRVKSNFGTFDKPNEQVNMTGSVIVSQPARNLQLASESLFTDLKRGEMHSLLPVVVTDDVRKIDAENITVFDHGNRILFGGSSRMVMQTTDGQKVKE